MSMAACSDIMYHCLETVVVGVFGYSIHNASGFALRLEIFRLWKTRKANSLTRVTKHAPQCRLKRHTQAMIYSDDSVNGEFGKYRLELQLLQCRMYHIDPRTHSSSSMVNPPSCIILQNRPSAETIFLPLRYLLSLLERMEHSNVQ